MYGDQFGEFVCGYRGLKSLVLEFSCVICYSLLGFLAFNVNHVLLRMHFSQSEGWKHL